MDTNKISELYKTLMAFVENGDEKGARAYLSEHINELPEDLKKKIMFEFFMEAVDIDVEAGEQKVRLQKEGMSAIKEIDKMTKELNDQKKLIDVRASIASNS